MRIVGDRFSYVNHLIKPFLELKSQVGEFIAARTHHLILSVDFVASFIVLPANSTEIFKVLLEDAQEWPLLFTSSAELIEDIKNYSIII